MPRAANWENQIGRRLRLRDLHVLFEVVELGSMSKAAARLGISQPAVSEVINNLEQSLGVQLLDRSPQGIEPTLYGRAFLKRSFAAFDELRQGIRDIDYLSDPSGGEVRIGCLEVVSAILPPFIEHFLAKHSRAAVHVDIIAPSNAPEGAQLMLGPGLAELRDRIFDVVVGIVPKPAAQDPLGGDFEVETLFADRLVVAAGKDSHWARRRKIDFVELVDASWILANTNTWNYIGLGEAFRQRGLPTPPISIVTFSLPLRIDFVTRGDYLTVFAKSIADRYPVKVLPLDLPARPLSVVVITPKKRTLSPAVERFIASARTVAKSPASE